MKPNSSDLLAAACVNETVALDLAKAAGTFESRGRPVAAQVLRNRARELRVDSVRLRALAFASEASKEFYDEELS